MLATQIPPTPACGSVSTAVARSARQTGTGLAGGAQTPLRLRADLRGCAWLVRLLPELAEAPIEPLPAWALPPEQERRLLFKAVQRFLANVAGPAGTLMLLDDLQRAGPDVLDLLATLVCAADPALRVPGAYRDTEVQPQGPLAVTLADLAHAGVVRQHALGALTPEEVGQLLAALLDEREGDRARLAD
jgi:predicted ATPase